MKPTAELRFIERESVHVTVHGDLVPITKFILQQKWVGKRTIYTTYWNPELPVEWRDVPCVKESE